MDFADREVVTSRTILAKAGVGFGGRLTLIVLVSLTLVLALARCVV